MHVAEHEVLVFTVLRGPGLVTRTLELEHALARTNHESARAGLIEKECFSRGFG